MPLFNNRSTGGSGAGSVIQLTPNHPDLQPTYHPTVNAAHEAANHQSSHYGGFKYDIHQDGKLIHTGGNAYGVEKTQRAQAYNLQAKAARR